jgi:hypothetical protein
MTRLVAVFFALAVSLSVGTPLGAQGRGTIEGVASGPAGPLSNATVQVIDAQGRMISKVITNTTGYFRITNLPTGTYTVQALSPAGGVISTASATIAESSMTATVTLTATAATMADAAGAAAGAGAAAAGAATGGTAVAVGGGAASGLSTAAIVGGIATAAAVAGTVAVVQTNTTASPSR